MTSSTPFIALTSDAAIDFTPLDFDVPLSLSQQQYLKSRTGYDIPQVFWRKQVHEDTVLTATDLASIKQAPDADAYITNTRLLPIAIRTADCVPIFIKDPVHKAIGLVHAGWKGTHKKIGAKTVEQMKDKFQSQCYDLQVVLGPAIRSCCYQVGEEFKTYFPNDITIKNDRIYVDIIKNNRQQLINAGVKPEHIVDSGICTCCNKDYFSFRRDGAKAGRMISLMMLL